MAQYAFIRVPIPRGCSRPCSSGRRVVSVADESRGIRDDILFIDANNDIVDIAAIEPGATCA